MVERRARREERRERQRAANVGRARAMHEVRLAYERERDTAHQLEFSQPANPPPPGAAPQFSVGCSGWYSWHWRGGFYPQDLPGSQWFAHYASHFRTVELNAPF